MPFAVSGQRLQAWFLEAPDDVRIFDSFYDRELSTDCTFGPAGAERQLCLPSATGDVVYLDAACHETTLRFNVTTSEVPPRWVSATATMGSPPAGYRVDDLIYQGGLDAAQDAAPQVFALGEDGCQKTSLQTALLLPSLYRLTRQSDESFVAAKSERLRLSDDFRLQRLRAEDGAELTLAVLGRDGEACEPQPDGVCVPQPFSLLSTEPGPGLFLDASCESPAFGPLASGQLAAPELGVDRSSGRTHVFELASTPAFVKLPELGAEGEPVLDGGGRAAYTCQPDARFVAWAPGAERTRALPVAGQFVRSTGLLQWVQQRAPHGDERSSTPFEAGGVFLDEQGLGCKALAGFDHQLGCWVESAEVYEVGAFSDAACEQRLYDVYGASSAELTPATIAKLRRFDTVASGASHLLSFRAYSGPSYRVNASQCELMTSDTRLLQVDRVLPLPRFERVSR